MIEVSDPSKIMELDEPITVKKVCNSPGFGVYLHPVEEMSLEDSLPNFSDFDMVYLHGWVDKAGYEYAYMVEFEEGEYLDSPIQEAFSGSGWALLCKEVDPYEPVEKRIYGYTPVEERDYGYDGDK